MIFSICFIQRDGVNAVEVSYIYPDQKKACEICYHHHLSGFKDTTQRVKWSDHSHRVRKSRLNLIIHPLQSGDHIQGSRPGAQEDKWQAYFHHSLTLGLLSWDFQLGIKRALKNTAFHLSFIYSTNTYWTWDSADGPCLQCAQSLVSTQIRKNHWFMGIVEGLLTQYHWSLSSGHSTAEC